MLELFLVLCAVGLVVMLLPAILGVTLRLVFLPFQIIFGVGAGLLTLMVMIVFLPLLLVLLGIFVVLPIAILVGAIGCVLG